MANNKYVSEESLDAKWADHLDQHAQLVFKKLMELVSKSMKDVEDQAIETTTKLSLSINDVYKKQYEIQEKYENELLKNSTAQEEFAIRKTQVKRTQALHAEYEKKQKEEAQLQAKIKALEDARAAAITNRDKDALKAINAEIKNVAGDLQKTKDFISSNKSQVENDRQSGKIRDLTMQKADAAMRSGNKAAIVESIEELKELRRQDGTDKGVADQLKAAENARIAIDRQAAKDKKQADRDKAAQERRDALLAKKQQLEVLLGFRKDAGAALNELKDIVNDSFEGMMEAIEAPISSFFEYQAKYEARLQGSENTYHDMMASINRSIGLSPFVKQRDMVKNLQTLIDKGINYNVELRAYIATVSEGIASTFDAFDSNLVRLIRIQQNDSTAARLGIEAALTKFFNNMYSDTSYLGQGGPSDQVAAALLEASAQLTHQGAAEMEFVAQKWLGSLYSLGVSGEAVQSIAQGLGYLGSGNIEQLAGNDSLMSLLAMSATRGGTSLSEILTGNLTAEKTNQLLQGMVTYLAEIANNTDSNNVTKSSLAQVFGITNTDLKSISNLSDTDISNIASTNLNYSGALVETSNQLHQIVTRTHLSQLLNNVLDNATTGAALTMGGNPALYGMAKIVNLISGLVDSGMSIPGITMVGSGTTSSINILDIAKAGIMGATLMSSLLGSINSLFGGGLPSLSSFKGYEQALQRGTGLKLQPRGVQEGFSESAQYNSRGSASVSDMGADAMQDARESAKENQSEEDKKTATLAETFYEEGLEHLATIASKISDLTTENNTLKVTISTGTEDGDTRFKLSDITDTAASKLSAALKPVVLASLFGDEVDLETPGTQKETLLALIKDSLDNISVRVTNDYFDESLLRSAMGGN